tara:strand:- start:113 stop:223 length:111 start_codon:yes stop_codon:yes gene_type:complete
VDIVLEISEGNLKVSYGLLDIIKQLIKLEVVNLFKD